MRDIYDRKPPQIATCICWQGATNNVCQLKYTYILMHSTNDGQSPGLRLVIFIIMYHKLLLYVFTSTI